MPAHPADATQDPLADAVRRQADALDYPAVAAILRSSIVGVFEAYCAANAWFPGEQGLSTADALLGLGCLTGAISLFALTAVRASAFRRPSDLARLSLRLQRAGNSDPELSYSAVRELEGLAEDGGVRRTFTVALGVASLLAGVVVGALTAANEIDTAAGVSITTSTGIVGALGLSVLWTPTPAERAWSDYLQRTTGG